MVAIKVYVYVSCVNIRDQKSVIFFVLEVSHLVKPLKKLVLTKQLMIFSILGNLLPPLGGGGDLKKFQYKFFKCEHSLGKDVWHN